MLTVIQISGMVFGTDSIGLNDSGQKTVLMIDFIVWMEWSRSCSSLKVHMGCVRNKKWIRKGRLPCFGDWYLSSLLWEN